MNQVVILVFFQLAVCVWAQQQDGPVISTENGNLLISSPGNLMFEAGDGGQVQFMSSDGEPLKVAEKGEKGNMGDRGDMGIQGEQGSAGIRGSTGDQGEQGIKGDIGSQGQQGSAGIRGRPGLKGDQGIKGDIGSQGNQGSTGNRGPSGDQGGQGIMGENGRNGVNGLKGGIGSKGSTGERGQQGVRGVSASDSALVTWNECTWKNLNEGKDYGHIVTCSLNKMRNDTWLRLTWVGNTRITRCQRCCMRWYFTINGEECADPGAIDMVTYQSQNINVLRQSIISGSCRATQSINAERMLTQGPMRVQFNIMECFNFGGFVYDAYTGWNSVSRITIEEVIPREVSVPEVRVHPPVEYVYMPNYCQYYFSYLGVNRERNVGVIAVVTFDKEHDHTVLRITWEGNLRKKSCSNCCTRWWIEIDGSPCSNFEKIETSITSTTAQDIFAPTTINGICYESGDLPIADGPHQVRLLVGMCEGYSITNSGSGFYSGSRLIVEELPRSRDPLVNPSYYHPQWSHCAIAATSGKDNGTLDETECSFNKTSNRSSIRVIYNGILRLANCQDCCMRWFITLNGRGCSSPAPIEAIIHSTDLTRFSLHRGSTVTGICDDIIPAGEVTALLNVGPCNGSNQTFDAFTGFNAPSTITLEEMPEPIAMPNVQGFYPRWRQCATEGALNTFINISDPNFVNETIQTCSYIKRSENTSLKISWDGNVAVIGCQRCCMRWYITIDGEECLNPGPIDVALVQDLTGFPYTYDLFRPASVFGICHPGRVQLGTGEHIVELHVDYCEDVSGMTIPPNPSDTITGLNSVSRIVIEEIPQERGSCPSMLVQPGR